MGKMTAKQLSMRAVELYYEGKHNELESVMVELAERAPVMHRRTVEHLAQLIDEQSLLDSVGEIGNDY